MQVELLRVLRHEAIDDLLVLDGAECAGHNALRLAALEEGAAVRAREDRNLHIELADLILGATVRTDAVVGDEVVGDLLLHDAHGFLGFLGALVSGLPSAEGDFAGWHRKECVEHILLDFVHLGVALLLAVDLARFLHGVVCLLLDELHDFVRWENGRAHGVRWCAALGAQFFNQCQDRLDAVLKTEGDCLQHGLLIDFGGADFDHVDAVLVTGEHQVDVAVIKLRHGWVDDEG